jgi:hypothetical protein
MGAGATLAGATLELTVSADAEVEASSEHADTVRMAAAARLAAVNVLRYMIFIAFLLPCHGRGPVPVLCTDTGYSE